MVLDIQHYATLHYLISIGWLGFEWFGEVDDTGEEQLAPGGDLIV